MVSFEVAGFHRLTPEERLKKIKEIYHLTTSEVKILSGQMVRNKKLFKNLVENQIGFFSMPIGIANGFKIDGKKILIPMVIEETSVIAAASATAKWISRNGFIRTESKGQWIIGQVQLPFVSHKKKVKKILDKNRSILMQFANKRIPGMVERGGGVREIHIREVPENSEPSGMLVIHVVFDPCDSMGANMVNQVCESLKTPIEKLTQEKVGLCILTNYNETPFVRAEVVLENISPSLAQKIVEATDFAKKDPYRATTHNKGVLNGIDAVLLATGNDWRAVEAGIHAYASRSGKYQPITDWKRVGKTLIGEIEIPLSIGIVGGMTRIHPMVEVILKILQVEKASDLARICAAVGLVQNLGALKALTTVGIVQGHMQLHASNLAIAAGASVNEKNLVKDQLMRLLRRKKPIHLQSAKAILRDIRKSSH